MDREFNAASLRIAAQNVRMTGLGVFITGVLGVASLMASFAPAPSAPGAPDKQESVTTKPASIEQTPKHWSEKPFAAKASINQKEDGKAGQKHGHPCEHHHML